MLLEAPRRPGEQPVVPVHAVQVLRAAGLLGNAGDAAAAAWKQQPGLARRHPGQGAQGAGLGIHPNGERVVLKRVGERNSATR